MKKIYSGAASGSGAVYAWEGNAEVGQGSIEITDSAPPTRVALGLHMIKPFAGDNQVVFTLEARGDSTTVTWAMTGTRNYIVKLMGLFFSMDKMTGKDFEAGLAKLKAAAEK